MLPIPKAELDKLLKGFSAKDTIEILSMVEEKMRLAKESRNEAKQKPLADFKTFIHTYFSHYITAEFGLCQNQLIQDVESFAVS